MASEWYSWPGLSFHSHTHHIHKLTHINPHTHTLSWAAWSPLTSLPLWSDHSPHWSEVIQWELPSFSRWSCQVCRAAWEFSQIKPSVQDYSTLLLLLLKLWSFESRWLFSLLSLPPSLSLTCTYLSRWISAWAPSFQIQPCTHSVTPSHSASHFQVPVFLFFLTGGNKISSSSHCAFSLPPYLRFSSSLLTSVSLSLSYMTLLFSLSVSRSCSLGMSGVGGVVLVVVIPWRAGLVTQSNPNNRLRCQSFGSHSNLKLLAKACQWSGESIHTKTVLAGFHYTMRDAIYWESRGFTEKLVLFLADKQGLGMYWHMGAQSKLSRHGVGVKMCDREKKDKINLLSIVASYSYDYTRYLLIYPWPSHQ